MCAAATGGRMAALRPPIVQRPLGEHKSSLIMLHGLGDQGEGWEDIGYMLRSDLPNTKFIFPHAPVRPITLNMGARMPGWFDIASLDRLTAEQDAAGMHEAKEYVEQLVAAEVAEGVPSTRVVVAGFSQGGAVALLMLRSEHQLAGVLGLSCYLPLSEESSLVSEANRATPVLMCHGDCDPVVDYSFGERSFKKLKEVGAKVELKSYRFMEHEARSDELQDVRTFLKQLLEPDGKL